MKRIAALINPAAGGGRGQRVWSQLETRLRGLCTILDARLTVCNENMTLLMHDLLSHAPEVLVVVGGDGSLNDVVNALLHNDQHQFPSLRVAYYNAGIGGDFARQFAPQRIDAFLEHIVHNRSVTCDVGKITFLNNAKIENSVCYFMNIASLGLSAHIVQNAAKSWASKKITGRYFYLLHTLLGLFSYRNMPVLTVIDEGEPARQNILLTAICNGQYFGRNMNIAPDASVQDGLLDLVSFEHRCKDWGFWKLISVYRGKTLSDHKAHYQKMRSMTISPLHQTMWVEADGDIVGQLPARFELLPAAFQVIV